MDPKELSDLRDLQKPRKLPEFRPTFSFHVSPPPWRFSRFFVKALTLSGY